jgi:hypothetical protein
MTKKACKPRKFKVQAEHAVYGPCLLVERRGTPSCNDVFLAGFPDKSKRTLLADARFWVTPATQLRAIPIKTKSPAAKADGRPEEIQEEYGSHDDVHGEKEMAMATATLQFEPHTQPSRPKRYEIPRARPRPMCKTYGCQNHSQSADCPFCAVCQERLPMFDEPLLLITATS